MVRQLLMATLQHLRSAALVLLARLLLQVQLGAGQAAPQLPLWKPSYAVRDSTFSVACNGTYGSGWPMDASFASQGGHRRPGLEHLACRPPRSAAKSDCRSGTVGMANGWEP